jgi:hypothetical protein
MISALVLSSVQTPVDDPAISTAIAALKGPDGVAAHLAGLCNDLRQVYRHVVCYHPDDPSALAQTLHAFGYSAPPELLRQAGQLCSHLFRRPPI